MFDFATPIDRHGTVHAMGLCRRPVWRRRSAAVHYFRYGFRHRALHSRRRQPAAGPRVFGYSRWRNEAFLGAIAHWYASRFNSDIDPQSVVYGPSVIYMVAETIRQWSKEGDGVVVHTPAYDAFYNTITANRRRIARCH